MFKAKLTTKAKEAISKLAIDSPKLRYFNYLARMEAWRKSRKEKYPVFENRYRLYDHLNETIAKDAELSYLEFGVSKGESLQYWSDLNKEGGSRFWGFDTFTGLPESWDVFTTTVAENAFSMNGKPPEINDDRISFVKGLFQDTLGDFLETFEPNGRLIIHHDADLYTSTLYVLCETNYIVKPGTILIFDEFSSVLHEFRAWEDYCTAYRREYTVLGATKGPYDYYSQIAVEMK